MATGDVQGCIERLKGELRHIRYPAGLDCTGAKLGVAAAFLPVLNYVLLKFSRHVAHQLVSAGYELQGKTDARFVEAAFKIFRDKFGLHPVLTAAQFLEQGFAERKLMLLSDVIAYCKSFHNAAVRRARLAAASAPSKSAATSAKAAASQASKGSKRSKAKSGLPKACQQPKVQRHSTVASEADDALAVAALQARLGPSSAQLAHLEGRPQSTDPNPWGPLAHALGTRPVQSRESLAMHTSHDQPAGGQCGPAHMPEHASSQSLAQHQHHALKGHQHNMAQLDEATVPYASQAWFVNPAFGHDSPMPSPEKQPRSQPPPRPHPSTYAGVHAQHTYTTGHASQQPSFASASVAASASPHQLSQGVAGSSRHGFQPGMLMEQQLHPRDADFHVQSLHGASGQASGTPHQQSAYTGSSAAGTTQQLQHSSQALPDVHWQSEPCHHGGQAPGALVHPIPQHQGLHQRHVFPTLPTRQQHQAAVSGQQHEGDVQQPGSHGYLQGSAEWSPQQAQRTPACSHVSRPHQHASQHDQVQPLGQHQQPLLPAHGLQQQQHDVNQQLHEQQQEGQAQDGGVTTGALDMAGYVQQLQHRLAAAEDTAAQAGQEGELRAATLEARITVLEGRVRFVEGELAAERERNKAAAQSSGAHRSGQVALCLSPAAKSRQDKAAAGPAVVPLVSRPAIATPHRCRQDGAASPTRSTAGTPGYMTGKLGVNRQLGMSGMAQQSPVRVTKGAVLPASPASSIHSYKSTSELIESIQNRYLEAQSFLKSYKL